MAKHSGNRSRQSQTRRLEVENEKLRRENVDLTQAKQAFEQALMFARQAAQQKLYDPNNPTTRRTVTFANYTSEDIYNWLQSPSTQSNQSSLQKASAALYNLSNPYARLVDYYAGLPLWAYVLSPVGFDPKKVNETAFRNQYFAAAKFLEDMDVPNEMRKVLKSAIRDGAFYGVFRTTKDSSFLQKLDPANCQVSSITDGTYSFAYNMNSVQESELDVLYPPEFRTMYNEAQKTGHNWQEVPDAISFCLKADDSVNDYTIPLFSAVMPMLLDIENYKQLQETQSELQNYKVLAGELPTDANGRPTFDWGLAMQYYQHICAALPPQVGAVVAPFKMTAIDFDKSAGVTEVDLVSRSTDNFWTAAGTTPALHGSAITTSGGLKLAITADEMLSFGLMNQAGRVLNRYLRNKGKSNLYFKVTFLPISLYNQDEMVKLYKDAATYGLAKSYYASAIGIPQYDVAGLDYIERRLALMDELTPLKSSHTQSSDSDEGGRPPIEDGNESDETGRTRDRS